MKTWHDESLAWLALNVISGIGISVFRKLVDAFGHPEGVFQARMSELVKVEGVRNDIARRIMKREFVLDPEEELKKIKKCNARIITYKDASYPDFLKEIPSAPVLLYVKGKDISLNRVCIAIVGSRNPTYYGIKSAEKIAFGLARRGIGVVSGLARGIDSAAHRGCLLGKGYTIAVMGTGIDKIYPATNKRLSEQIMEGGCLVSEFTMGSPPEPKNFPIRNRIISGLSRGIVVVEATKRSGSLITASFAIDQGREVFAVPGSIDSFKSMGTHLLIKQGAKLIENADDIIDEFEFGRNHIRDKGVFTDAPDIPPDMSASETKVYEIIGNYPMHIDQIVRAGGMDAGEISSILMQMELKGIVKQLPGKMFVR
jgi:DNA processing protein